MDCRFMYQCVCFLTLIFLSNGQDDLNKPPKDSVDVQVGLKILHFGPLDEKSSKFTVMLHVHVFWLDKRLANKSIAGLSNLEIGDIWKPALYFANSKTPLTSDILDDKIPGPISSLIDSNGKVSVMKKIQLDASCQFNVKFYPMDTQYCSIQIESSKPVHLNWTKNSAIQVPNGFQWADYDLKKLTLQKGLINYDQIGFSERIEVTFQLRRLTSYYLFNIYLPSTLFTIISWSSFWVDIPAAPARVALVLTTMLTHVTSTKAVHDQLPKTMYLTSLDIWITTCTMFIFAAIMEYATANYFYHKPSRTRDKNSHLPRPETTGNVLNENNNGRNTPSDSNSSTSAAANSNKLKYHWYKTWTTILPPFQDGYPARKVALEIDRRSRYVFPIVFIIFNILYWSILAIYSDQEQ